MPDLPLMLSANPSVPASLSAHCHTSVRKPQPSGTPSSEILRSSAYPRPRTPPSSTSLSCPSGPTAPTIAASSSCLAAFHTSAPPSCCPFPTTGGRTSTSSSGG